MKALLISALVLAGALVSACSADEEPPKKEAAYEVKEPEFAKPIDMSQFADVDLGEGNTKLEKELEAKIAKLTPEEVIQRKKEEQENPTKFLIPTAKVLPHAGSMRNRLRIIMQNRAYFTTYSHVEVEVDYVTRKGEFLQKGSYTFVKPLTPQEIGESHYFQKEESPKDWIHNIDGLKSRAVKVHVVPEEGADS